MVPRMTDDRLVSEYKSSHRATPDDQIEHQQHEELSFNASPISISPEHHTPMRLIIDGRFMLQNITGVQRVAIEFTKALDEMIFQGDLAGIEAELVIPRRGDSISTLDLKAISLRRFGSLTGHLWEQLDLPRYAKLDPLLCLGNLAPVGRLLCHDNSTYVMVHDLSYRYYPGAYSRRFRLVYGISMPIILARASHVFTVSQSEMDSIRKVHPRLIQPANLTVVQNGGGLSELDTRSPLMPPPERSGGLYVGSLSHRKNGKGLILAATELARTRGLKFTFVGCTPEGLTDVDTLVDSDAKKHFRFFGQVNDPIAIANEYQRAAVFVFPSLYEASPLPPIEAMSHGCPVVCSDIPSLRERCGDAALYCDPTSTQSIVNAVNRVLSDEKLQSDLRERGYERARKFNWKSQAQSIISIIRTAEQERRPM